jgi:hypothetical protein
MAVSQQQTFFQKNKKRIFTKHPFRKAGVIFGYRFLVP